MASLEPLGDQANLQLGLMSVSPIERRDLLVPRNLDARAQQSQGLLLHRTRISQAGKELAFGRLGHSVSFRSHRRITRSRRRGLA
jgi:hypothetical protein